MTRTRFAPSPTGYLHIGGARTALYCWLEARRHGGQFILRIEDTDRERSTQAAIDAILEAMDWLGLDYDEGPVYQTQRLERYREVAEQMVAAGTAYYAYETKEELEAMREKGKSVSELTGGFTRYPQILVNVKVREKLPFEDVPEIARAAALLERELDGKGRLLLRYSGTENLARVMIEGENQTEIEKQANHLAQVIAENLG